MLYVSIYVVQNAVSGSIFYITFKSLLQVNLVFELQFSLVYGNREKIKTSLQHVANQVHLYVRAYKEILFL